MAFISYFDGPALRFRVRVGVVGIWVRVLLKTRWVLGDVLCALRVASGLLLNASSFSFYSMAITICKSGCLLCFVFCVLWSRGRGRGRQSVTGQTPNATN